MWNSYLISKTQGRLIKEIVLTDSVCVLYFKYGLLVELLLMSEVNPVILCVCSTHCCCFSEWRNGHACCRTPRGPADNKGSVGGWRGPRLLFQGTCSALSKMSSQRSHSCPFWPVVWQKYIPASVCRQGRTLCTLRCATATPTSCRKSSLTWPIGSAKRRRSSVSARRTRLA